MNDVIKLFYENVIPEMLNGHIDCEIIARIICNVYFTQQDKLLLAYNKYDVEVPTLIINNAELFNEVLSTYVETVLSIPNKYKDTLSKENYIKYIIAASIANMGTNDYLNPINYYKKLTYAIKNNPVELGSHYVCEISSAKSDNAIRLNIDYENISQECPFKCVVSASNGTNEYLFQTIRFFVIEDRLYIGAIQGRNSSSNKQYESEIRRLAYKLNSGIPKDSKLLEADPSAVLALTIFISYMKKNGINKVTLLPYGIARFNEKKILAYDLPRLPEAQSEVARRKIVDKISQVKYYFDNFQNINNKLLLTLERIKYEFGDCFFEEFDGATLDIQNMQYSDNEIANLIFQEINTDKKKNY